MKDIFNKLGKKIKGEVPQGEETKKIMEERSQIKMTMAYNLKVMGFSEEEIDEVLFILTECEQNVQELKDLLIGSNINNDDTAGTMKVVFDEIRKLELQAAQDIREKIAEIKKRKGIQ